MQTCDWPLVAFTLLMQAAIGTFLVGMTVSAGAGDLHAAARAFDVPLAAAACAGGLALLASLLHLGRPSHAWLALTSVRTSWLSREILASVVFVASVGVLVVVPRGGPALFAPTAVLGLFVMYAMSRLYMIAAQPAWNRLLTPVTFFASALLLGVVLVLAVSPADPVIVHRLAFVAIGLLVVQGLVTPVYLAGLPREPAASVSPATFGSTAVRLATARASAAIVAIALLLLVAPGVPAFTALGPLAFAFVIVSEVTGRVLFYAGAASIGPVRASTRG